MWHIYTMEYYSAIKRNEIELFVVRWMDLETFIQNEVSQKEKTVFYNKFFQSPSEVFLDPFKENYPSVL